MKANYSLIWAFLSNVYSDSTIWLFLWPISIQSNNIYNALEVILMNINRIARVGCECMCVLPWDPCYLHSTKWRGMTCKLKKLGWLLNVPIGMPFGQKPFGSHSTKPQMKLYSSRMYGHQNIFSQSALDSQSSYLVDGLKMWAICLSDRAIKPSLAYIAKSSLIAWHCIVINYLGLQ